MIVKRSPQVSRPMKWRTKTLISENNTESIKVAEADCLCIQSILQKYSIKMATSISCLDNVPRRPQPKGSIEIRHPPIVVLFQALARSEFSDFPNCPEVEFTIFPPSRVYLGFLKLRLESRFQEVAIHQFRAKNATWVAFFAQSRDFQ